MSGTPSFLCLLLVSLLIGIQARSPAGRSDGAAAAELEEQQAQPAKRRAPGAYPPYERMEYLGDPGQLCSDAPIIKWKEIYPRHGISYKWTFMPVRIEGAFYRVKSFPLDASRTARNYAPARNYAVTMDTVILSQIAAQNASRLGDILESWKTRGLSSHYIVTEYFVVEWIPPTNAIAQMAGSWNSHSLEILVMTDEYQAVRDSQIKMLEQIIKMNSPSDGWNIDLKHMASYKEARCSGSEGFISNIDYVREKLCLSLPTEGLCGGGAGGAD